MKERIFKIIQIGQKDDIPSRTFDILLVVVIITNIISMILQTFDELTGIMGMLRTIEIVTTLLFCIEYILRIWTADLLYPELTPGRARIRFLYSFDGIIDLLTIIPAFFLTGFVVFRMLRVVRIFHLFRINAQYDSFNVITTVLKEKKNQILSSVFIILMLMVASSLCMYSAEHDAQPDVFRNAFSGIYWAMGTVLTVGYGDIYPITTLGRAMAIVIAFLGVGAVAIPTGIISAGFVEQYTRKQNTGIVKHTDVADIIEIVVDSSLAGCSIRDLKDKMTLDVYLIIRNGITLLPSDDTTLISEDIVVAKQQS